MPVARAASIHSRLLLGLVIPLTIVAALVSIETFLQSHRISNRLHDQTLLSVMLVISENAIVSEGDLLAENILEALTENLGDQFFYHVSGPNNAYVIGYSGVPQFSGVRSELNTEPIFYDSSYQGDPVRAVTVRQLVVEQELNGWMTITAWQRVSQRRELALNLFTNSIVRLLVIVVSAGFIVWIALSFGLRPLEKLRSSIERRSPEDLTPIRSEPPVEVKSIVRSMNRLFEQVARASQLRERFIGDAAHQLRNPIAAIKTQSEIALNSQNIDEIRSGVTKILQTTENTGRLIEQLLTSARAHAQNPALAETFELETVVRDVALTSAVSALNRGYEFVYEEPDRQFMVKGYPRLFAEAILNLIDNAIQHTPEGTHIVVGLEAAKQTGAVEVYVADEAAMFSDDEFQQLLQPFATGVVSSQGTGLGLSVVDDIAKMHGGHLSVRPGRNGKGKELTITLPVLTD